VSVIPRVVRLAVWWPWECAHSLVRAAWAPEQGPSGRHVSLSSSSGDSPKTGADASLPRPYRPHPKYLDMRSYVQAVVLDRCTSKAGAHGRRDVGEHLRHARKWPIVELLRGDISAQPTACHRQDVLNGVEVRTIRRQATNQHARSLNHGQSELIMDTSVVQNQDTALRLLRPR